MTADSPPSLLITPDRRRRLQQQFEHARRLAAQPRVDFRQIHDLLADCLAADPGNILYLDALLANLKQRQHAASAGGAWRSWLLHWWRPSSYQSSARQTSQAAAPLDAGAALWRQPTNVLLYRQLAAAAAARDDDEIELRYLMAARDLAPDDVDTLRNLAQSLTRQGQFEEALGPWFAVLAFAPNDSEAQQAVTDLRSLGSPGTSLALPGAGSIPSEIDGEQLLQLARHSQQSGNLNQAEQLYTQAQAALGGDLALLEVRENLRLGKSHQRLEVAELRASHDPHPRTLSLIGRLEQEHLRLEIEIFHLRAERLPENRLVRLELARRLKAAGNYSGAIQRLEEALRSAPHDPALLVELGECWQHLRQFTKAISYYEQAISDSASEPDQLETRQLARYRAGVLAAALGRTASARAHFQELVSCALPYRDARERLASLDATNP